MLTNYLKFAIRSILKRKVFSSINIIGLAIGISVCLVIWRYIEFELSYEIFHEKRERIYRLTSSFYTDGAIEPYTGYDLGPALKSDMPEVKSFVRTHGNEGILRYQSPSGAVVRFQEGNMLFVDSTFLDLFTFEPLIGNPGIALDQPSAIVLTETAARKYFGKEDPIGKLLNLTEGWVQGDYQVTCVLKDVPENSTIKFDFLVPIHNLLSSDFYRNNNARWDNFFTYVEIHDQAEMALLQRKIPGFIGKYKGEDKKIKSDAVFRFQPITRIHFSMDNQNEGTHLNTVYFFMLISIFILGIAWVNYINLSTAKAMERAREVGVKKAIGAQRIQLIAQFITESVIINLFGAGLAIILAILFLPILGNIVGRNFEFDFAQTGFWLVALILFIAGSLVSGFYPAFILSSFKAIDVIKGGMDKTRGGLSLRRGLVVFQFTASLLLIAGTFTIFRQIRFMQSQDKGINIDNMLVIKGPQLTDKKGIESRLIAFKNELLQSTSIAKVATSLAIPGGAVNINTLMRNLQSGAESAKGGNIVWVDPDFIDVYDLKLKYGKEWNVNSKSDMRAAIINESAFQAFGLGQGEDILNQRIVAGLDTVSIIGVVRNFHWNSMHRPYSPLLLLPEKVTSGSLSIKLNTTDISKAIKDIENKYTIFFPGNPFTYFFVDDFFNEQYKDEQQFSNIFGLFSILAIIIACVGLGGLASFTTNQRLKEIGIRKVLGASAGSIVALLSRKFLSLIMVASTIALPVLWLGSNQWFQRFAYRITFSWDLFAIPAVALLAISQLIVGLLVFRGANINPAKVLRTE